MKREFTKHNLEALLCAPGFRDFLRLLVGPHSKPGGRALEAFPRLSYAELTRRSGFSSRAYIRDVIHGTKNLSPQGVEQVITGLRLPKEWAEYFRILVGLESQSYPSSTEQGQHAARIRLEKMRDKLRHKRNFKSIAAEAKQTHGILESPSISIVYAALGSLEEGATYAEIWRRARLPEQHLQMTLDRIVKLKLARYDAASMRYFAADFHLILQNLGAENFFEQDFAAAVARAGKRFRSQANSPGRLFLVSNLCIKESLLPQLKIKLRDTIEQFVSEAEESSGDLVIELLVAMTQPDHGATPIPEA